MRLNAQWQLKWMARHSYDSNDFKWINFFLFIYKLTRWTIPSISSFKINKKKQTVYKIRSNTLYNGYLHNHDFRKCPLPCRYRRTVSIRSYRLGNFWNLAKFDWNSAWYLRYARHTESIRDLIRGTVTGRTCRVASDNPLDIPRENGSWRSGTIVYIYS